MHKIYLATALFLSSPSLLSLFADELPVELNPIELSVSEPILREESACDSISLENPILDQTVQESTSPVEQPLFLISAEEPAQEKALPEDPSICGKAPRPMRITARHIESNGIGYNQGYTTLEGFFAPDRLWNGDYLPFLDLRGHLFNDGRVAANAGLGFRYLSSSHVWGINAYYDLRNTKHRHYNQVSMGLECLGSIWDFRINGYLPFGKKKSALFDVEFDRFKDHYAFLSSKFEFAMKGINAEAGYHWNRYSDFPLYIAVGPYCLEGQGKVAWGGEARVALDLFGWLRLEGNTSYDNVFKWIGQGQVSVNIPFGPKRKVKKKNHHSCSKDLHLASRMLQRVDRFEIIAADRKHQKTKAIDPLTGQPYFFWFVNNTSHSDGSFESPFNTLVAAQHASSAFDVIYVYPGNGTSTGMNAGFVMKNNQKIWGSGVDQILATTIGTVTVPAESASFPLVTNGTAGVSTIILANACEVSGLNLQANMAPGIIGGPFSLSPTLPGINDTLIKNNILANFNVGSSAAIYLPNCQGNLQIINNHISNIINGDGINVSNITALNFSSVLSIISNQILMDTQVGAFTISIVYEDSGLLNAFIMNNFINNNGGDGISFIALGATAGTLCGIISGNTVTNNNGYGLNIELANTAHFNANVHSNVFNGNASGGVSAQSFNNSILCLELANNMSLNDGNPGYILQQNAFSILNLEGGLANINQTNIGSVSSSGMITTVGQGACSCPSVDED